MTHTPVGVEPDVSASAAPVWLPTVAIETHGCKLNQADSSALAASFLDAGYRLVSEDERADVYVVNTCTVTHVADRKARSALRSAGRRNPDALVVAAGCYAQRAPDALRGMDGVGLVVGNTERASLVRRVLESTSEGPMPTTAGTLPLDVSQKVARTRAMVKIQEGCDQVCAYCVVPKVRGRERSIPAESIIEAVNAHVAAGCKEVVLTGTQLGSYGFDLPDASLTRLIERVLSETEVPRLRVSSVQPQEMDEGLLSLWSDRRLCPHFHLALQSGSDEVLRRMRRRYTAVQYVDVVAMVREAVRDVAVTADVIVGFPGETERQFEETRALCDEVGFAAMHVFPYSARPGTSAAHFGDGVSPEAKSHRVRELISLSRRHAAEFRSGFIGTTRPVLWEGPRRGIGPGFWGGLTDNYIRVVGRSADSLANEIRPSVLVRQEGDLVLAQVLAIGQGRHAGLPLRVAGDSG